MKHPNIVAFIEAFEGNGKRTNPKLIHMVFCIVVTVIWVQYLQMWPCFFFFSSWWPSVYCYGVLQWWRLAPEDPATENHTVLHGWCRLLLHCFSVCSLFLLVHSHLHVFFLFRSCSGLLSCVLPLSISTTNEFYTEIWSLRYYFIQTQHEGDMRQTRFTSSNPSNSIMFVLVVGCLGSLFWGFMSTDGLISITALF